MKLSIIIPFNNKRENITKVCICLSRQRFEGHDVDLILVDHASTDGVTEEELRNLLIGSRYEKIIYHKIEVRDKWSAAIPRNVGAKLADRNTDAFYFLDSDILLPPDRIQRLLDDVTLLHEDIRPGQEKKRVIIGPYHFLNHSLDVTDPNWYQYAIENYSGDVRWKSFQEHNVMEMNTGIPYALSCFGGSIFIPRELFFQVGMYDEELTAGVEDGAMGLQLLKADATFSLDKDLLGWHNYHEIKSDRTADLKEMVKKLNLKHFGKEEPDYGILEATKEAYGSWGFDWHDPKWEGKK